MKNYSRMKHLVFCLLVSLVCIPWNMMSQSQNTSMGIKQQQDSTKLKEGLVPQLTSETISFGNNNAMEKRQVTSAINKVSGSELMKTNSFDPGNSLYGLLPGLMVLQNPGAPGYRSPTLHIRGLNTLGNNNILVLVDGVETDLSTVSTQYIKSVEVLKDAAAVAIYGQRGANGVLLITTKEGVKQSMDVNVSYETGLTSAVGYPHFLDATKYARAVNEARRYDGLSPLYSSLDLQAYKKGNSPSFYPNVNWIDESLRGSGIRNNLNASFRGGGENIVYFAGINYQDENGLYKDRDEEDYASQLKYDRLNFRTNLGVDLTSTTKLKANIFGGIDEIYSPGRSNGSIINAIYTTPANAFPVKNFNGNYGGTNIHGRNPVADINSTGYSKSQRTNININATLTQDLKIITKGLSGELSIGHNNIATSNDGQHKNYLYEDITLDRPTGDTISQVYGKDSDLDPYSNNGFSHRYTRFYGKLNYEKHVGAHDFKSFVMYSQDKSVSKGHYNTYIRQNFAGNFHYGYQNKYLADVTLSYAGTSNLPKDRFDFYPAVSAAWVISNEDFIKENSWVHYLKLRGSFGYAGSDRIQQLTEDQSYGGVGNYFFTQNNKAQGSIGEGRLAGDPKTERAMMSNIGIDANLFKKMNLVVDAFYNKRSDILVSAAGRTSNILGVAAPVLPIGEVSNRGLEASLTWQDKVADFNYSATASFSYTKNKIEEMSEAPRANAYRKRTGQSIGQAFGLVADGFFNSQSEIDNSNEQLFSTVSPGDVKYVDQNGDNIIDEFDEVPLGYSTQIPEMYFSLNLHADYKGFGVNAIIQGVANKTVYLNTQSVYWPLINNGNITSFSNDRWTKSTMNTATLPRLTTLDNDNNYRPNSIWLKNGDYLKLRTLEFYFNLPSSVIDQFGIDDFQIFARGTNLVSLDHIQQMDPESISINYPLLKSINLGLSFTF